MTRQRNETAPPPEYAGHSDDCGCGCQLTAAQWRAEAESDAALRGVEFDGCYTTESTRRTHAPGG